MTNIAKLTLAGLLLLSIPSPLAAYIGPGAGVSAIGAVIALVGAVLLALVGWVWYPLKRLYRAVRPVPEQVDEGGVGPAS